MRPADTDAIRENIVAEFPGMPADGDEAIRKDVGDAPLITATPYTWRDPETIVPRDLLYGRQIQRGLVHGLIAPGAAGKTIFSIGRNLAMATGRPFLGQVVHGGPKRVWLWNLEDDGDELARIIQAACKHWSIGPEHLQDRFFVDSGLDGAVLKLAKSTKADGLALNRPVVEGLIAELIERSIDYLHVDPFVSSHDADESSNMEMDAVVKEWAQVAKRGAAGIGLAHHTSKAGAIDVTALSGRGAVALINACRSVLTINRMSDDEAKSYGIEGEVRRRYFRVYDDKPNRAPPSDTSAWFHLASVDLGNATADRPSDSVGVVEPWAPPDAFEGVTVDHLYHVQVAIDGGRWRENCQASDWAGRAVAKVMGLRADKDAKADRARILKLLGEWISNGALVVETRDDDSRRPRKWIEVGAWAVDGAPPVNRRVEQGGASGAPSRSAPPASPLGGGGGGAGDARSNQVERSNGAAHGAAAPYLNGQDIGQPILAPGEDPNWHPWDGEP